ncbi:MAG: sensor histidine kinase [Promethearchaeota archaeon]
MLFSLIVAGIILAIILYFPLFFGGRPINWLFLSITFAFYILILVITFISTWVFLKRISVMKEVDRLNSIFLGSMSHELRTPLTSILGFTNMILRGQFGELNKDQEKQLKIVLNSANHLNEVINDLIDTSKIEADKLDIKKRKYDLIEEIVKLKEVFNFEIEKKGLEFSIESPKNLVIYNDKKRINQILVNLIGNAIKFTENGKISISINKSNNAVEITVKDTGKGIKKEDMIKLFKPFSRIISQGEHKEGTGLGLYIAKKLATLLDAEIFVESEFGKGSTFKLLLNK